MSIEPKQAASAKMAIAYITVGALMSVWSVIYYLFSVPPAEPNNRMFWITGAFLSGLVLAGIGFFLGRIGLAARQAEVAPVIPVQAVAAPGAVAGVANPVPGTAATAAPANPVAPLAAPQPISAPPR